MNSLYVNKTLWILAGILSFSLGSSAQVCNTCDPVFPINNGLLACYRMNNNTDDASGNNRHGTTNSMSYTTDRLNTANQAASFNATGSNAEISYTAFQVPEFTYSLWVNISALPTSGNYYSALSIGNGTTDQAILLANNPGPGHRGFSVASYNSDLTNIGGSVQTGVWPTLNRWYHVVMARSVSDLSLYVDGVLVKSVSVIGKSPGYSVGGGGYAGFIGKRNGAIAQSFNGKIDDVRIYNRALSAAEISQLYDFDFRYYSVNAGLDKVVCEGDSVQLTATGTVVSSYTWTPSVSLSSPSAANTYAKPLTTTEYFVTGTTGTCSATDTVTVTVNNNCCATCTTIDPINAGLMACYPFSGSAKDASGNGRHGTPSTSLNYSTDKFSAANSSGSFNGLSSSNSDITYTDFQLPAFTYSLWVNVATLPSSGSYYSAISIGNDTRDQAILLANNSGLGHIGFGVTSYNSDSATPGVPVQVGTLPSLNRWYHLVMVRNASNLALYVDGVLVKSISVAGKSPGYTGGGTYAAFIGRRAGALSQNFNGKIDDVRIYNRVLSAGEISQLYTLSGIHVTPLLTDKTIFLGDSVQLIATGGTNYLWSPSIGLSNATIANPFAKPDSTQQYIVAVSNGRCSAIDTVVVHVDTTVVLGISHASNSLNKFKIYPNPAHDVVIIDNGKYLSMSSYTINIFNALGQSVFNTNTMQQQFALNAANLGGPGIYFIQIQDPANNTVEVRKLIIE